LTAFEKHYSVQQIAKLWGLSDDTIRRIFQDEDGVLKIGSPETRFKRKRIQLSIPESVLQRVYKKLTA
jgi:transcriptional regulator GlxA family with amidase domain